jgi:hypothetical protein
MAGAVSGKDGWTFARGLRKREDKAAVGRLYRTVKSAVEPAYTAAACAIEWFNTFERYLVPPCSYRRPRNKAIGNHITEIATPKIARPAAPNGKIAALMARKR